MHRWQQHNGDLDGDAQPPHSNGPLDIDALLQLASQNIYWHDDSIDGAPNSMGHHRVRSERAKSAPLIGQPYCQFVDASIGGQLSSRSDSVAWF